jgi:hypothetical protein
MLQAILRQFGLRVLCCPQFIGAANARQEGLMCQEDKSSQAAEHAMMHFIQ